MLYKPLTYTHCQHKQEINPSTKDLMLGCAPGVTLKYQDICGGCGSRVIVILEVRKDYNVRIL